MPAGDCPCPGKYKKTSEQSELCSDVIRVSFKSFTKLQTQKRYSGVGNQYFSQLALFGFIVNLKKRCDINN